jgi:hypothetical protein
MGEGSKANATRTDLAGDDAHFRAAEAAAAVADLFGPNGDALRRRQLLHGQADAAAVQVQANQVLVACKPATTTSRSAQNNAINGALLEKVMLSSSVWLPSEPVQYVLQTHSHHEFGVNHSS